jgi:hypothetical protein
VLAVVVVGLAVIRFRRDLAPSSGKARPPQRERQAAGARAGT